MAMHAIHKILAMSAGEAQIKPGQYITSRVDLLGITDVYLIVVNAFRDMLGSRIWDPGKVFIFLDHNAPASNLQVAENHKAFRAFAREQGCRLFDINEGSSHSVFPEQGLVRPGNIVVITDSHTPIHGAYGALGLGVGVTDAAAVMIDGTVWLRVPHVIQIRLDGRPPNHVMAKDIALYILGRLGTDFANYRVIEFCGPVVDALSLEERTVLTVMATEMGAKSAYIQPDGKTVDYIRSHTSEPFTIHETDADYAYEKIYTFDVSALPPQVAAPHSVDNVRDVSSIEGIPMDQVFVGSCTGGKHHDIEVLARALEGKRIAPTIRLVVTMATREIVREAVEKGYYRMLLDAGATITSPGCGGCSGLLGGILAAHEKCASTANRNFPGRMGGSLEAEVYLVSPLTAAATALTGKLTDPSRWPTQRHDR